MNIPTQIFAADKIEFTENNSLFTASSGWTAKYNLLNATDKISFVSTADGDTHAFTITSATSGAWAEGTYTAVLYYEHTDGTYEIEGRLTVTIKPNLITSTTYDFRSTARRTLEAIEAAIERRASKEQLSIQITVKGSSRALQYAPMDELIKAKTHYQAIVKNEEAEELIRQGKNPGGKVLLQFN